MVASQLSYYPTVTREDFITPGRITDLIENGKLRQDLDLPAAEPGRGPRDDLRQPRHAA